MPAAKLNLPAIEKGATFRHTLTLTNPDNTPMDLTGCTAKLQVRPSSSSSTVLLELSTENSRIVITPLSGIISLVVQDDITSALQTLGGVYDLEIYHPNEETTRLIEGKWVFKPEVTRG